MNYNRLIFAGHLTREPSLKTLPSNVSCCEFGMASNYRWKDRDGKDKEEVCFVDVTAFGRNADTLNKHVRKGMPLLIEGRLRQDRWNDRNGKQQSRLTVIVEKFVFVGKAEPETPQAAATPAPPPADDGFPF